MSLPRPRQGGPGERPGFNNGFQCVKAVYLRPHPSAPGASVYPSVKWADEPCLGQCTRRPGDEQCETCGEVPALCTQEKGQPRVPEGNSRRGGGGEAGHLRPVAKTLWETGACDLRCHLQREAHQLSLKLQTAQSEVSRGHSIPNRQGTSRGLKSRDPPSATVLAWSPRPPPHHLQLRKI